MFLVGSLVRITDISECKKVELNEVFKVLSSSKAMTTIENKDGINLGGYYSWRFVAVDTAKSQVANATEDDWFYFDKVVHANHFLRKGIDQINYKGGGWIKIDESAGKPIKNSDTCYQYRCKKCHAPAANPSEDDWFHFDISKHVGHVLRRDIDQLKSKNENDGWTSVWVCANTKICSEDFNKYEFRCKKSDTPKEFMTNVAKPPEDDWFYFDNIKHADHILRQDIDQIDYGNNDWIKINTSAGSTIKGGGFKYRCKKSDAPVADATKSQAAETKIKQQDTKMFKNKFQSGQTVICKEYEGQSGRLTIGKGYVVIDNDPTNSGSNADMISVINNVGNKENFFAYRFSAAIAENVATAENTTVAAKQPKRIVAKVTNTYLTKGQSYEVVDDDGDGTTVIVGPNGYSLCFMDDCFESDISLSDVTNVDGATGENEMKKETAVKVASVVGKFAAGWGFRALNYWVFEPAAGIGRPIMKSVRYATFLGGLAAVGYGYYHPQEVKDALVSCLPTVSIEAPAILSGK